MSLRRYKWVFGIAVTGLAAWAAVLSFQERTYFQPEIEKNPVLKAAVREHLAELRQQGRLTDWYCSSVVVSPTKSLFDIAPDCEFARLNIRQRWWRLATFPYAVSRLQVDVASRESDGRHRLVLQRFGDMKTYPEFLVWAHVRIQSEDEAVTTCVAAYGAFAFRVLPESLVACQDSRGVWSVAWEKNGCLRPIYRFRTDEQGFVTGGEYIDNVRR